jgi:hypothetical protein
MLKNIYFVFSIAFAGSLFCPSNATASDKLSYGRVFPSQWLNKNAIAIIRDYLPRLEIIEGSEHTYKVHSALDMAEWSRHHDTVHSNLFTGGISECCIEQKNDSIVMTRVGIGYHRNVEYLLQIPFRSDPVKNFPRRDHGFLDLRKKQVTKNGIVEAMLGIRLLAVSAALTHGDTILTLADEYSIKLYRTKPAFYDLDQIIGDQALEERAKKEREECHQIASFHNNPIAAVCKGDINKFYYALANRVRPKTLR